MGGWDSIQDFKEIPLKDISFENLTGDPSPGVEGRIWTRTDLHTLKVWLNATAKTLATTDDSRFTDSRIPTGTAGGDLAGTYPNPTIKAAAVDTAEVGAGIIETGVVVGGTTGTAVAGSAALRKLGTGANDATAGNDSRLSDSRIPTGTAAGDLAGTYPNPTIKANGVVLAKMGADIIETGVVQGGVTGTAASTIAALRKLGTGANDATAGNDSRLSDSRVPTGAAGGDLAGTYPNPTIGANKVTLSALALALIESGISSGTAGTNAVALRRLGFTANDAMAGNTSLDAIAAPAADVDMNAYKITNVATPTSAQDAATKNYVDSMAQGLDAKTSVRTISVGVNVILSSVPSAIGGVIMAAGDRFVAAGQTAPAENGIYVYPVSSGNPASRAADMDTWSEVPGAFVFVEEGVNADSGWVATANAGGTLGTTAIPWTQFSSAGSYVGGAGLTLTGLTFDVNVDDSSIEINSDILRVKAGGITNAMLAGSIDLTTKVTGVLPAANGGKSSIISSPALTAGTWTDVTHSLGVKPGHVMFKVASTNEQVGLDYRDKAGSETTIMQIKTDIAAGRAAAFYDCYVGI